MKKAPSILAVLFLVFVFATGCAFAAGVDLTGIGARAQALGGNYRAISNDWSGMYWNPAGLAFTNGLGGGFSVEFVTPKAGFTVGNSHYGNLHNTLAPFSAVYRSERFNEGQTFVVPSGGITLNMGRLTLGVGVWAPFGLGSKWDILRTANNNLGTIPGVFYDAYNSTYPNIEYESSLQITDIHPTVAYKISDKLSVGAGASIVLGDISIRQPVYVQNPYLYNEQLYQTLLSVSEGAQKSILNQMNKSPFDHLLSQAKMDGTGNGYGANFGVMYKPNENWSIGASLQWYSDISMTGTLESTTYFADAPFFNGMASAYSDSVFSKMLAANMISAEDYFVLTNFYSGMVVESGAQDVKTKLPLPMKAGIGVSYTGFKNLLIAADVRMTQWSAWDQIYITDANGATITSLVEKWKDTLKFGVGLEYTAGVAKLRAGFSSEPAAAVASTMTVAIPDINRRNTIDVGLLVPVGPLAFSLNYERILIADRTISQWSYDSRNAAMNLAGDYSVNVNNVMVGLDLNF